MNALKKEEENVLKILFVRLYTIRKKNGENSMVITLIIKMMRISFFCSSFVFWRRNFFFFLGGG